MECTVCNDRSEVDCCVECRALLCEVCGETCEQCRKMVCPEHKRVTSSGHIMCLQCFTEREERHGRKAATADTSLKGLAGGHQANEEDVSYEALTASQRKPPDPWKISLAAGVVALLFVLMLVLLPDLRRSTMPWGAEIPTPIFVFFIAALSIVWAVRGLINEEFIEQRQHSFMGIGVSVLACVLAIWAIQSDPARQADLDELRQQQVWENMSPEERRKSTLNRFSGEK